MSFGASIAILGLLIAFLGVVALLRSYSGPKSRRRRIETPLDSLSDPPTITHYGHG